VIASGWLIQDWRRATSADLDTDLNRAQNEASAESVVTESGVA
jgi:hypothetical protein